MTKAKRERKVNLARKRRRKEVKVERKERRGRRKRTSPLTGKHQQENCTVLSYF